MSFSKYCHLNSRERAPFYFVKRQVERYALNNKSHKCNTFVDFDTNQNIIHILHAHGWRKREYISALIAHEKRTNQTAGIMCKRPLIIPATYPPLYINTINGKTRT